MPRISRVSSAGIVLFISGMTLGLDRSSPSPLSSPLPSRLPSPPQAVTSHSRTKTIVFIGDSLAAGYGVKKEEAFPERVGVILKERGHDVKIINAGIPGAVTAEADRKVKWYLRVKPDLLVLELGANDGLKGTPPEVIKRNLAQAIDLAQANDVQVVLAGIRVFTNFGSEYSRKFEGIYRELAREKSAVRKKVVLIPFLLEGVALKKELNQADGKHPNAEGHAIVAANVARTIEPLLTTSLGSDSK